jgi:hypothetical protein
MAPRIINPKSVEGDLTLEAISFVTSFQSIFFGIRYSERIYISPWLLKEVYACLRRNHGWMRAHKIPSNMLVPTLAAARFSDHRPQQSGGVLLFALRFQGTESLIQLPPDCCPHNTPDLDFVYCASASPKSSSLS